MAEQIKLAGSIAGFGIDLTLTPNIVPPEGRDPAREEVWITGSLAGHPVDLKFSVSEDGPLNLSGRLLGKECIVNGSKT